VWSEGSREHQLATAIAAACRRLHARGLLAGSEGNLSLRFDAETVLVSASAVDKATMEAAHVVRVSYDGRVVQGGPGLRASSEFGMHHALYAARPGVMAIVHAHPPVATGFAAAGQELPANVLPEVPVVVGRIAAVPYGRPGTAALAAAMAPYVAEHDVFLLANHGVTVVGYSLEDAILRMESTEQAARIVLAARLLGGAQPLPPEEVTALASYRRSSELL
jgi:L-fuculose-phosphate aldolase